MNRIKFLIIRLGYFFLNITGNIIKFFRGNKNINIKHIKKIIFNRKDRIGDAVITKPLIILFSKYLREELKLDIIIGVECSNYNSFVFNDGTEYYDVKSKNIQIKEPKDISTILIIKNYLLKWINTYKTINKKDKDGEREKTVYVDLIGSYSDVLENIDKKRYFIGCNLGLYNNILDYSLSYIYGNSNKNLIESYINLLCKCFNIPEFKNFVYRNIEYFYQDYNNSNNKSGILISVGTKEYRNLNTQTWIEIIKFLSKRFPSKTITVIDDNSNRIYNGLKIVKDFYENVDIKENKFSLQEFKNFASNFELLIGIDGGGFNYIRTISDSVTIYTIGNYNVRNIFTGPNNYKFKKLPNKFYYGYSNIGNKKFGYIYKKSIFLPSHDIGRINEFNNISDIINQAINCYVKSYTPIK